MLKVKQSHATESPKSLPPPTLAHEKVMPGIFLLKPALILIMGLFGFDSEVAQIGDDAFLHGCMGEYFNGASQHHS